MKRLWFKARMKDEIIHGAKTATTRAGPLKVRELYRAVSGSRFKAEPFAVLKITSRREVRSLVDHVNDNFRAEGFRSGPDMADYIREELPVYLTTRPLFYHTFKVVSTRIVVK